MKKNIHKIISVGSFLAFISWGHTIHSQMVVVNVNSNQTGFAIPDAGSNMNLCSGDTVQLNGSYSVIGNPSPPNPISYNWVPAADLSSDTIPNPVAWPSATTEFFLTITDGNNCTNTDSVLLTVFQPPSALFSFISTGLSVDFTDLSTGSPTAWVWDFGDGNTSILQHPSHLYDSSGTYIVCLTAGNAFCSHTTCDTLDIILKLDENFIAEEMNVYPNPFSESTTLEFNMKQATEIKIETVDIFGRRIETIFEGSLSRGRQKFIFDSVESKFPSGLFLLVVQGEDRSEMIRIIREK